MKTRWTLGIAFVLLAAGTARAYLPSAAEVRKLWQVQRSIHGSLYLGYDSLKPAGGHMDIYIRADGLWAKRLRTDGQPSRTVWKWGPHIWVQTDQGLRTGQRNGVGWDDWAFEPLWDDPGFQELVADSAGV